MAQLKTSPDRIWIACLDQLQEILKFFISTILTLEEKPFGKRVGLDFGKDVLKSQAIYKIGWWENSRLGSFSHKSGTPTAKNPQVKLWGRRKIDLCDRSTYIGEGLFGISPNSGYLQDIVIWINSWRNSHELAIFEGIDFGIIILDSTAVRLMGWN